VQDDEPFDWETNAATNTGQGKRGAKGASHGSGREKDKERRERKEREREKRDKDKVRQRSRDQRAAAVVNTHGSAASGGDGGGGGGGSETDCNHLSNSIGGDRRGSTLQHAAAAPNASLSPVVEPELPVEAPYRPGGARDAQPQAYAPGGNAARSRGDMAVASSDAAATSGAGEKQQSIHANAVRICFTVVTRGSCPKVECSLFHPPRNPPRPALVRCPPTRLQASSR